MTNERDIYPDSIQSRRTFLKGATATAMAATGVAAVGGSASAQPLGVVIDQVDLQSGLIVINVENVELLENVTVDIDISNVEVTATDVVDVTGNVITVNVAILGGIENAGVVTALVQGVTETGRRLTGTDTQRV